VNTLESVVPLQAERVLELVDERTVELLDHRRATSSHKRRGWLVRRALLIADVVGLIAAFALATWLFGGGSQPGNLGQKGEYLVFLLTIPGWIVVAKIQGLYERDEERADHSTVDDFVGVFHLVTVCAWLFLCGSVLTNLADPDLGRLFAFWAIAIGLVPAGRAIARGYCRRSVAYLQNTVIVGAGEVGQVVARKFLKHPEYGMNVVGFVDAQPKERRADLEHLTVLGSPEDLPGIISLLDVERVVVAFSNESDEDVLALIRMLSELEVQIDVVPRLFDIVGPRVGIHTVEGLPLVGLPPARISPSSRLLKRALDIVVSSIVLVLTAPLFAYIAWRIRRDSPGPVFFRQTRLGLDMNEFTALKFRTMKVDTDEQEHREYIAQSTNGVTALNGNGLFKLDRSMAVTPFGSWLRKTSLDELPQLINVLRGEMSLVGPRPCIPYETELFKAHQFERFLVPAGMTGLWQVTARANSTFNEALDMDVAYVRGWSLGLDLRLLCRTPIELLRQRKATA